MAVLRGNNNNNNINGTNLNDVIFGYGGLDQIFGLDGADTIYGGNGRDSIFGNNGNDYLDGDRGEDDVFGGAGNDRLFGGIGADADFLFGGEGNDTLYGGHGFDFLNGGSGSDTIIGVDPATGWTSTVGYTFGLRGVTVNLAQGFAIDEFGDRDRLINIRDVDGTDKADTIIGDASDNFFTPYQGADSIDGGDGIDELNYNTGGTQGITANLVSGVITDNFGDRDTVANIENIRGSLFTDRIIGGAGGNTFRGLDGDDVMDGGAGYDEVWYDRDIDFGGFQGADINLGGGFAFDGFGKLDSLIRIEGAKGTVLSDTITGTNGANTLDGFFGDDTLLGGNGNDLLIGGQGDDRINGGAGEDWASWRTDGAQGGMAGARIDLARGNATDGFGGRDTLIGIEHVEGTEQADTITGDSAGNSLVGLGGNDIIRGGGGADTITGGAGNDTLTGQGARDRFVFGERYGNDRITDFNANIGEILDFSGNGFVRDLGDVSIVQQGANTRIATFDGSILLLNVQATDVTAANFVF